MNKLLTILTMRSASTRTPNKAMVEITSLNKEGKKETLPLCAWVVRRLQRMDTDLVVATTNEATDNQLAEACRAEGVEVYRGSTDDVIDRMDSVVKSRKYQPDFILRALGDCVFLEQSLVEHAVKRMAQYKKDAFIWATDVEYWPLYGAREMPLSARAFSVIVKDSPFREHPDQYFHTHRKLFDVLYHLPPKNIYYRRSYRTEIDYPLDISWLNAVVDGVGIFATLEEVVNFLDRHPDIAKINSDCVEKTGPLSLGTYDTRKRREWLVSMTGKSLLSWSNEWLSPPSKESTPIFCNCGHIIGWGENGRLYTRDGSIIDVGYPRCSNCGLIVRHWQKAIPRAV